MLGTPSGVFKAALGEPDGWDLVGFSNSALNAEPPSTWMDSTST
jgi:hypothetical protein